jgi:hypothetical protein
MKWEVMAEVSGYIVSWYDRNMFKALHGTPEHTPTEEAAVRFAVAHWNVFPGREAVTPLTAPRRDGQFLYLDVSHPNTPEACWVYRIMWTVLGRSD